MKDWTDKFANVGEEEDTKILLRKTIEVEGYPALYERWSWEGIHAETLVFDEVDVGHLNDAELRKVALASQNHDGNAVTTTRNRDGYAFVNFNFRS